MATADIAQIRKDYTLHSLNETGVAPDPIEQFTRWWEQALSSAIEEVNAMVLSTVNASGDPESRVVLLKGFDENGFVFFTNYQSDKGTQLQTHARCSLLFFWKELERQVRINGTARRISEEASDAYFNSRPAGSRIGAWASPQSKVVASASWLDEQFEKIKADFGVRPISRPPHWGGFVVEPLQIEFWQGRPSRMHDRIRYTRSGSNAWSIERLAP